MNVLNLFKLCLFASLLVVGIIGCSKPTAENATLEGRWSGFESGQTERITIEFTGNHFAYWDAQTNELGSGTFVVNDTVQPMQIDLTFEQIAAPELVGKVGLAIYELNGDELKFAGSEPGSIQRPPDISGGPGVRTFALQRE